TAGRRARDRGTFRRDPRQPDQRSRPSELSATGRAWGGSGQRVVRVAAPTTTTGIPARIAAAAAVVPRRVAGRGIGGLIPGAVVDEVLVPRWGAAGTVPGALIHIIRCGRCAAT